MRVLSALILLSLCAPATAVQLDIPAGHPRLWFNDAGRLASAQQYWAQHPLTPSGEDAAFEYALRGLLTGSSSDCRQAADWLMAFQPPNTEYGQNDQLRWFGEQAMLVYDWCHGSFTGGERDTLIARWNGYIAEQNVADWGGLGMQANNYFWGHLRNSLLWGITSHGENAQAQGFIDDALDTFYVDDFGNWYETFGRGGVMAEGSGYGPAMLGYPLIGFTAATDYGFDAFDAVPFFRDALYAILYSTTPSPTVLANDPAAAYRLFPFNDDELFNEGGIIAQRSYLGDFVGTLAMIWDDRTWASHARAWQQSNGALQSWLVRAATQDAGAGDGLQLLPLDFHAAGADYLYLRSSREPDASVLALQLGSPGGIGHVHRDAGSFQFWRDGRFLSRETAGIAAQIVGWDGQGTNDVEWAIGHNSVLFQGWGPLGWGCRGGPCVIPEGQPRANNPDGLPELVRLQSAERFAYAAVDLSPSYRARDSDEARRIDWPYSETAIREFVFLRESGVVVVLDRLRASSDSLLPFYYTDVWAWDGPHIEADAVRKTFVLHTEVAPTINGARATATLGGQTLDAHTLLPAAPVHRVIAEGGSVGQQRIEIDTTGAADSWFLHVLHGRDTGAASITPQLTDLGDRWRISFTAQGTPVEVELAKGMQVGTGHVRFGTDAIEPLYQDVQGMVIDAAGPRWLPISDLIFVDDFEP
jgi:hypothetical protein